MQPYRDFRKRFIDIAEFKDDPQPGISWLGDHPWVETIVIVIGAIGLAIIITG